jgi:predicted nucleic acid-binding protein
MNEVLADTSGWAAWLVRSEPFHALADTLMRQWHQDGTRILTTNYILAELVALLTSPLRVPRPTQILFYEDIKSAPWVEIIHTDLAQDRASWDLLKSRPDKKWSFVDCSSFVVMQQRSIREALTTDHHFEQAGFVRLLK